MKPRFSVARCCCPDEEKPPPQYGLGCENCSPPAGGAGHLTCATGICGVEEFGQLIDPGGDLGSQGLEYDVTLPMDFWGGDGRCPECEKLGGMKLRMTTGSCDGYATKYGDHCAAGISGLGGLDLQFCDDEFCTVIKQSPGGKVLGYHKYGLFASMSFHCDAFTGFPGIAASGCTICFSLSVVLLDAPIMGQSKDAMKFQRWHWYSNPILPPASRFKLPFGSKPEKPGLFIPENGYEEDCAGKPPPCFDRKELRACAVSGGGYGPHEIERYKDVACEWVPPGHPWQVGVGV